MMFDAENLRNTAHTLRATAEVERQYERVLNAVEMENAATVLDKSADEIERLQSALKDTLDHCDERDNYWNTVAYEKRQAGKDDTSACARAAEAARIAEFFRGRFVAFNRSSPTVDGEKP